MFDIIYRDYDICDEQDMDMKHRLNRRMSCAIYSSLKGNKNGRHWENLVDYTLDDLIKHLEKNMPKDYDWQDYLYGELHLDHILPLNLFQFTISEDKEFKDCWSLWNLRLLPAKENLIKKDKINPILLGLLIATEKMLIEEELKEGK